MADSKDESTAEFGTGWEKGADTVKLAHGSVSYRLEGDESAPLVVCVHGISGFKYQYRSLSPFLAGNGYRVLTYDLYGRGYTDVPHASVKQDLGFFVTQLHELLEILSFVKGDDPSETPFTVLGLSLGGAISVGYAHAYPSVVSRLVLMAPAGINAHVPWTSKLLHVPGVSSLVVNYLAPKALAKRSAIGIALHDPVRDKSIVDEIEHHLKWLIATKTGYVASVMNSVVNFPLLGMQTEFSGVGKHTRPVHIIWGTSDVVVPYKHADRVFDAFPNASVLKLEETGHMPQLEQKDTVHASVLDFLKSS